MRDQVFLLAKDAATAAYLLQAHSFRQAGKSVPILVKTTPSLRDTIGDMKQAAYLFLLFFIFAAPAEAKVYHFIETPGQNDVLPLAEPTRVQALYGELKGYPQMYEFYTKEPMDLSVEVLAPAGEPEHPKLSGIILRVERRGNVTEIARLSAKQASWEKFRDWWTASSYVRGASYRGEIAPGTYRVEVSTPENIGRYTLQVGTEDSWRFNIFSLVADTFRVQRAVGAWGIAAILSPYLLIPLLIITAGILAIWWRHRIRPSWV